MHGLTFEMKRAHVAAYRFAFDELRAHVTGGNEELFGRMTPARLDILFVLYQGAQTGAPRLRQNVIWQRLGLHRSTISKAISAMVEIGYVVRSYLEGRSHHPFVSLTAKGRGALNLALQITFATHALRSKIESFFQQRSVHCGAPIRRGAMRSFLSGLASVGRAFCSHFEREADVIYPIDPLTEL